MLTLNVPLSLLNINIESFFTYQIPYDTYISSASPSNITYNLMNPPSWSTYDIGTRTLSGTPSVTDIALTNVMLQVLDIDDVAVTTLDLNVYAYVNQADLLRITEAKKVLVNSNSVVLTWKKDATYQDVTNTLVFITSDINETEYYPFNGNTYSATPDYNDTASLLEKNLDCTSMTPLTGDFSSYKCIYNGTASTCVAYNLLPSSNYKFILFSGVNTTYFTCDSPSLQATTFAKEETNKLKFNVKDATTKLPVQYANITLLNKNNNIVQTYTTDELGVFDTYSLEEGVYSIKVEHGSYITYERVGIYNRTMLLEYPKDTLSINDNNTKNRVVFYNAGKPFIDRKGIFDIFLTRQ